jgi:hypothetical protein
MIVKYKYSVDGSLRFQNDLMFEFKGRTYEFETDEGDFLTGITVSVKADADQYAPKVTPLTNDVAKYHIHIKDEPASIFIKEETRNLEGVLSLFGMNEIDLTYPEISWIPENAEEKAKIHMPKYKAGINQDKPLSEPFPPDLMARAIMTAYESFDWQIPFTFYRKAMVDYKNGWFLEACYDYYFLLEYLFADGKFKTNEVKKNFKAAPELQAAIKQLLHEKSTMQYLRSVSQKKYKELLENKTTEEISDFFIDLRGKIHHQSKKNKKGWHPANQQGFKFEAELFTNVCFNLMMKTANDLMFSKDIDVKAIKCMQKVSAA